MAESEVGLRATLKDRAQTAAGLRGIKSDVDQVGQSARTSGKLAAGSARGFDVMRKAGHAAATAIKAGFAIALTAGYGAYRFLKNSVSIARDSQKIQRLTAATIKATGKSANVTAGQVKRYSEVLSVRTGIERESIQTGENVLLMFKNVRNELGKGNDIYKRATQASIDLSSTPLFKGNITGATKALGKLLQDPVKNISALSRAGVQFTGYQVATIKHMIDQNNLLGAQRLILRKVNNEAGGAAAAQATWGDKAHQMWHNIEDEIGTALLPLLDRVERWFVKKGGKAIEEYSHTAVEDLVKVADKLGGVEKKGLPLAKQVFPAVKTTLGDVYDIAKKLLPVVTGTVRAFNKMPSWAQKVVVGAGVAGYVGQKTGALGAISKLVFGSGSKSALTSSVRTATMTVQAAEVIVNGGIGPGGVGGSTNGSPFPNATTAASEGEVAAERGGLGGLAGKAAPWLGMIPKPILPGAFPDTISPGKVGSAADFQKLVNSQFDILKTINKAATLDPFKRLTYDAKMATKGVRELVDPVDHLAKARVAPPFSTPGITEVKKGVYSLNGEIAKAEGVHQVLIHADTRAAMAALNGIQNYQLRDKYIQVHTVQGSGTGGEAAGHGGGSGPTTHPRRAVPRVAPRAGALGPVDLGPATPIVVNNTVLLDGKVVAENTVQHLGDRAARK